MACRIERDKDGKIERVLAPNGQDSKLYKDLVNLAKENIDQFKSDPYINKALDQDLIRDASPEELALAAWSKVYSAEFKVWFDDWENSNTKETPQSEVGYTRLYRSNSGIDKTNVPEWLKDSDEYKEIENASGRWFYKSYDEALYHKDRFEPEGYISYIDIKNEDVEKFNARDNKFSGGYGRDGNEYFIPKELSRKAKRYNPPVSKVVDDNGEPLVSEAVKSLFNQGTFKNLETSYQKNAEKNPDAIVATDKTIRSISERLAHRIGLPVEFISDKSIKWKGKIRNDVITINTAKATLDTPVHEILGHPVIRAIKNTNKALYNNLSKELNFGKGQEVFDRIKNSYPELNNEQQKEEAIVELLGLYTAEKLDKIKDKSLIGLLKELLSEMRAYIRKLFSAKELEVANLPFNIKLNDLANIFAYRDSKIILPGYKVTYTTPDNKTFETYEEANNYITNIKPEDIDLDETITRIPDTVKNFTNPITQGNIQRRNDGWYEQPKWGDWEYADTYKKISDASALIAFQKSYEEYQRSLHSRNKFSDKNTQYEYSWEALNIWKKENDVFYNPEDVYRKGHGFYSVIGAYSNFDVELMFQNILSHIEDNEKAGGEFIISSFTKDESKKSSYLESKNEGSNIRIKIYPKADDIKWAATTDVYSGSVWDAASYVSKDVSEKIGVSYSKAPSAGGLAFVTNNLSDIIDKQYRDYNELGIALTGGNFRLEYDENIPYSTKKVIDSINNILDQKYGEFKKPKIVKDDFKYTMDNLPKDIRFRMNFKEYHAVYDSDRPERQEYKVYYTLPGFGNETSYYNLDKKQLLNRLNSNTNNLKKQGQTLQEIYRALVGNVTRSRQKRINEKIKKLKEQNRKYPRALIRSKVEKIEDNKSTLLPGTRFQKDSNDIEFTLKVIHGLSQLGINNIKLINELNLKNRLASKGVTKDQIDLLFQYLKDKNLQEINTNELIRKLENDLIFPVSINLSKDSLSDNKSSNFYKLVSLNEYNNNPEYEYQELTLNVPFDTIAEGHFADKDKSGPSTIGHIRGYKKGNDFVVIEFQSDLFQKNRKSNNLSLNKNDVKQNRFLQFLNEDDRWIRFFIKAIVQNFNKNNEGNILFPSGKTALKVQGHEIIEEHIRLKEEELQRYTNSTIALEQQEEGDSFESLRYYIFEKNSDDFVNYNGFSTKEDAENYKQRQIKEIQEAIDHWRNAGLDQLKPIESFYENRVRNILIKDFNSDKITDKHGYTWNKVEIKEKVDIYLELEGAEVKNNSAILPELVSLVNSAGFKVENLNTYIKDYIVRTGEEWNQEGVNALVDFANKVIALKEGKEVAFNEEAAHLAIALSPISEGARFERALEQVVNSRLYALHAEAYKKAYKLQNPRATQEEIERKTRIEILGKILLENIIDQKQASQNYGNWLSRFLTNLWSSFISMFKTDALKIFIDEITTNILSNNIEYFNSLTNDQGTYFSAEEVPEELTEAQKIRDQIITSKNQRLKRLKARNKLLDAEKVQGQIKEIESVEAEIGLTKFIEFLSRDLKTARKSIEKAIAAGKVPTNDYIANITDFINFYKPSVEQLKGALLYGDVVLSSDPKENKALKKQLNKLIPIFNEVYEYNRRSNEKVLAEYVDQNINDPDFDIRKIMQEPGNDINTFNQVFGTPRDIKDPFTRIIYNIIGKAFYTIKQLANTYGKQLINTVYNDYGIKTTSQFAERDSEGKTTGFFISKFRLGDFFKAKDKIEKEFKDQENADELIEEWLLENTERRFTPEYYKFRKTLSTEANEAMDMVNAKINNLLNKYKNQDLTVDVTEISDEDWKTLKEFRIARRHLANLYDADGNMKTGMELSIAKELKAYYEKLFENVEYKPNMQKFEEAKAKIPANKRKLWTERNTELRYSKEFWEEFKKLVKRDYGQVYSDLSEERLELLRPFRQDTQEIELWTLPEAIQDRVKEIDKAIQALREGIEFEKLEDSDLKFSDIAEIVKTDQYYLERNKASKEGRLEEWIEANHYYDSKGYRHPHSYWTKFKPKKAEHIQRLPTREWQELSENSNWFNHNYDPNWVGLQPKASKWGSNALSKLSDKERDLLDFLVKEKHAADIQMKLNPNMRLPQMSQSFMDLMYNRSNLLSGMKELVKESVSRRVDDDILFGNPDNEYRADGTKVSYVARKYTRPIENPETISTDILSSIILYREGAINYQEMSKIASQIENIHEQLGNRPFKYGKRRIPGSESNVFKLTRAFIDTQVYGMQLSEGADFKVRLLGKDIQLNTAKLTDTINSYVRNNNLIFNLYSILSNITGGAITASIDTIIGRYATKNSLGQATKEFGSNIQAVISENSILGKKANKKNKMNLVLEFFGVIDDNDKQFDNLDKESIRRLTPSDLTYVGWNQGAYMIKSVPALAVLFNQRYDTQSKKFLSEEEFKRLYPTVPTNNHVAEYNKLTSIYDMLEVDRGAIVVKPEYKEIADQNYLAKLNALVIQRVTQIDGNVTPLDRTIAHRHVWWKLVTTHRGWLIDGLARRWKGESKNLLTGMKEVGYHRYFFQDFLWKGLMSPDRMYNLKQVMQPEFWNQLEPHQREAVYRSLLDIAIVMGMTVLAYAINGMADDDDELDWAAYLSNRVLMEVAAISPTPFMITELTQIINSPVAGVRQIETLMDITDLFSSDEIERGKYEGLSERERLLIKLIPGIKGYYGSHDPGSSNQFIKQKALKWQYKVGDLITGND